MSTDTIKVNNVLVTRAHNREALKRNINCVFGHTQQPWTALYAGMPDFSFSFSDKWEKHHRDRRKHQQQFFLMDPIPRTKPNRV